MSSLPFAELSEAELLEEYMDVDQVGSSGQSSENSAAVLPASTAIQSGQAVSEAAAASNSGHVIDEGSRVKQLRQTPAIAQSQPSALDLTEESGSRLRHAPCRLCRRNHPITIQFLDFVPRE